MHTVDRAISGRRRPIGHPARPRPSVHQRGYALVMVIFFLALVAITVSVAAPSLLQQGRREKEQEMIWRGNQYIRGIKLFYLKNHRIPASLEELLKPQLGVRYMRKAYKDPMNAADGSWRLIQIGRAGQLIGSVRPNVVFTLGVPGGGAFPTTASPSSGLETGGEISAQRSFGAPSVHQNQNAPEDSAQTSVASPGASDSPVFGSSVIGVGSKAAGRSVVWLNGAKNYHEFEFIWDPSKENMGVNPAKLLGASADPQQQPLSPLMGQPNGLRSGPQSDPTTPPSQ